MSKILIVEDDKYLNKLLSDRFSLEGFEVASVLDGDSALERIKQAHSESKPYDILLTDMLLPRMMGAELITKIRENPAYSALKIHAMSGIYKDDFQIKEITTLHNLEAYWTKPFDIDGLVESLTGKKLQHVPQKIVSGSIQDTNIENLFFGAYDKGFTGRLLLRTGQAERKLYFMNGFPVAAESSAVNESLGHSLIQLKLVTQQQRDAASEKMVTERLQFGQVLIQMGVVTEPQLFEALRKHTYRLLLNTFTIRQGTYEFHNLDNLPSHIMVLEFNPALLILKAQSQIYTCDFIHQIFEPKMDFFAHRTPRFHQVIPLFNLDDESKNLILGIRNDEPLKEFLQQLPEQKREMCLRVFFALESLHLLEWKSQPNLQQSAPLDSLDLQSAFENTDKPSADVLKTLQSRYVQTLNKSYFELLDVSTEASEDEVASSYREIRYALHPDRFGNQLDGQTKRILDDILARIDKAYQTLTNQESRAQYLATLNQARSDSIADSKRYLEAQSAFREGQRLLANNEFERAMERFQEASQKWKRGIEYEAYATFAALKLHLQQNNASEASKLTQKLRDSAHSQPGLDTGFILLGHAYYAQGKLELAKEAYQKALAANEASDEAANALAGLGEKQFKKERVKRAVQNSKSAIQKTLLWTLLFGVMGSAYFFKDDIFYKEDGIETLKAEDFKDIAPILSARRKDTTVKLTTQRKWITTVPEAVMKTKCLQFFQRTSTLKIDRAYWYDEEKGLRVYCYGDKMQTYK